MKLSISTYQPREFIKNIAQQLGAEAKADCLEEYVELSGELGVGRIAGFQFGDGVAFLLFDCMLNEDWALNIKSEETPPLQFNFNVEGEIWHTFNDENIHYHLNTLQGSMTACPTNSTQLLKVPGKRKILYACLWIDREKYLNKIECIRDLMPDKLKDVFEDLKGERSFFHQDYYSIAAAACIKKITDDKHDGLVRSTFLEAKALELLSKQIKQFTDDILEPTKQTLIRKFDVDKIKYARDILLENLQKPPIIEVLAKKVGINQQKLKKGFKLVFDTTINKYVTGERLERASLLLLKGLTVRETASEVGYINYSHFAKKFKEYYGVLPKDYLKSIKLRNS